MDDIWLIYTAITAVYILLLVVFFWRRTRIHEQELEKFLQQSKLQLDLHKQSVHKRQHQKISKVMAAMSIMQQVAVEMDKEIAAQYQKTIEDARAEAELIIKKSRDEAETIRMHATHDLDDYRKERLHEVEADLVKLVINVTEKVMGTTLSRQDHVDLIYKSLEEVKSQKIKM